MIHARFTGSTAILSLILLLPSCSENLAPDSALLQGSWRGVRFTINDQVQREEWATGTILGFSPPGMETDSYYRNYETGTWMLQKDQLTFTPPLNFGIPSYQYTILELTDNRLVLQRINVKVDDLSWRVDEFPSGTVVTMTEEYQRIEN